MKVQFLVIASPDLSGRGNLSFVLLKMPGHIYILTNKNNTVLYTGVTSNLKGRIYQHRQSAVEGFTKKYNAKKLVYYECCDEMLNAIDREKQIKSWKRSAKIELIEQFNPNWKDLYDDI